MKKFLLFIACLFFIIYLLLQKSIKYINNGKEDSVNKINFSKKNYIEIGDVLKIDVKTAVSEVSALYNNIETD